VDRQPPRTTSDEIDLYIRTYYSLLRSSGNVRVRAFEEAHAYSASSLHPGAAEPDPDVAAFAYSAARLPACLPQVRNVVLGQSSEQFEAAGFSVREWPRVRTRGRRRPMRWNGGDTLACYVSSTSDIDDLVPIVTAYQIEWNKIHTHLSRGQSLSPDVKQILRSAFVERNDEDLEAMVRTPLDLSMRLLAGSFMEYQRAAQRWWGEIEGTYVQGRTRRPVYVVSSNTHSLVNLLGGYARAHKQVLFDFARKENPEDLDGVLDAALRAQDQDQVSNCLYYLLRTYLRGHEDQLAAVQAYDAESGITDIPSPGHVDVGAQLIELRKLHPERMDPRLALPGLDRLAKSDAVILNIDYPLGMAAYHHLSRMAQGLGEIRGVYVMGKAATLNGRVGDVAISQVAYDEHSRNTFMFPNCFNPATVQPFIREATVLDGQKALTVRGSFLQNRQYMGVYYREGYTVLEMEAGPYLSAIYEIVYPKRHPQDEIVNLSTQMPFDFGLLHYASDTPYSRRQSLLSKSLSFFGVESSYGCATAIARRILAQETARLTG
jgi:hypothetical protein